MDEKALTIPERIDSVLAEMDKLEITNQAQYQTAGEWLKRNKQTQTIVKEHFEPERLATYQAYKAVTDTIKGYLDKLTRSERSVKRMLSTYMEEQDRKRREEERRLAEIARKREEERLLAEAIETGDESVLEEPVEAPVVHVEAPPKVDGVSYVEHWTFEITDPASIPREYLIPDEKKIRQVVRVLKGDAKIAGVRIYAEKTVRAIS